MRRYGKRRTFRRKRTVQRRRGSRYIRRTVRRTVRAMAETKFHTLNFNSLELLSLGQAFSFADDLTVGTSAIQRIGNRIEVQRISFKLNIVIVSGTDATAQRGGVVRVLVLFPRKGLNYADLAATMSAFPFYSRPNPERVIVMYDRTFPLLTSNPTLSAGNSPNFRQLRYIKRTKFNFNFSSTDKVDREPIVYIYHTLNDVSANPTRIFLNGYTSMSFKDL